MTIRILKPWLTSKKRPRGVAVDTIVMHSTAGASLVSDLETLLAKGLAYHYAIDRNGDVSKLVPSTAEAAHAGSSWGPHEQAKGVSAKVGADGKYLAGCSVNPYSIGIAFVNLNDGHDPITLAQQTSARELITSLVGAFPIRWLTSHRLVTMNPAKPGRSRKVDPRGVDMRRLAADTGLTLWEPWQGAADLPY